MMKKQLLIYSLLMLLSLNALSQSKFESAYYINNADEKINCLIKNMDWEYNPIEFEYKLSESASVEKGKLQTVKEFGVEGQWKYLRNRVDIDMSSAVTSELSTEKEPIFEEKEIFLKVLVEGKGNLYVYQNKNEAKYFFNTDTADIEQLIFKKYRINSTEIATNSKYKEQLWLSMKCPNLGSNNVENLYFAKKSLIKFFTDYNTCNNQSFTNFEKKQKRDLYYLSVRTGLNFSSLLVYKDLTGEVELDFGSKVGLRFGAELEFVLPFKNNKWSVLFEPSYQYFNSETENPTQRIKIDYNSIELPIGLRRKFFLKDKSTLYLSSLFATNIGFNSNISYNGIRTLDIPIVYNLAFAVGYIHNEKYSLELRAHTNKDIQHNYGARYTGLKTYSIIIGYRIVDKKNWHC